MKKLVLFLFVLIVTPVQSAQIVNVEYIHNAIKQKWDITVPYNAELSNPRVAANMKYLLTAVDVANEMLNGEATTNYGNGEYATMVAADTIATDTAVETLIAMVGDYKLSLTHYYYQEGYSGNVRDPDHLIMISAAGTYNINWGDGTKEVIVKDAVGEQWFGHDYAKDGIYTVRIGGQATKYAADPDLSTVILGVSEYCLDDWNVDGKCPLGLRKVDGCLGCIFPTLDDGSQPRFIDTFADVYGMDNIDIPSGFFTGIYGAPVENMFDGTFAYSSINSIPSDLFAGIQGAPARGMFASTFAGTAITSIPENLFAGIQGPPAEDMFASTFRETYITSIPENLFAGIQGPPAEGMFHSTFAATSITSIPENLFAGIDATAPGVLGMFQETFIYCFALTGPSARINGQYLYEIWPDATHEQVMAMYYGAEGLDDWDNIPDVWKQF